MSINILSLTNPQLVAPSQLPPPLEFTEFGVDAMERRLFIQSLAQVYKLDHFFVQCRMHYHLTIELLLLIR